MNWSKAATAVRARVAAWLLFALSPATVAVALFLTAAGCLCAGVRLMWGDGWALMAAGLNLYVLALALAKGVTRG